MNETDIPRSFNLTEQPWIPIAGVGEVSLTDVFRHPEYARLGGTPVEKVVIMRLLLCIAHACCELRDDADWYALTPQKLAENALAYLEKWKSRFDLLDEEHPFLQFPQLNTKRSGEEKPIDFRDLAINASNNRSLFTDRDFSTRFSLSEKARLLLCGVCYSCRKKSSKILLQYALMGEYGFLHSFLLGRTLLDTIHNNMLTKEDLKHINIWKPTIWGAPFWESMPSEIESSSWDDYRNTYQGCLIPINKFYRWDGQQLWICEGIPYISLSEGFWDPGVTLFSKDKKMLSLSCKSETKPWRMLGSIFMYFKNSKFYSNAFLRFGLPRIMGISKKFFGVWCGGISASTAQSKNQNISGENDYINSEFLIPMEWKEELSFEEFEGFMEIITGYSSTLEEHVKWYYVSLNINCKPNDLQIAKDKSSAATRLFWEMMEPLAQSIIELSTETDSEKIEAEKKKWREIGMACYERFCPCISPRQIQVYVQNRPYFVDKKEKSSSKKGGKNE